MNNIFRKLMRGKCAPSKKARKSREFMRSIIDNLKRAEEYNKGLNKLSEIDTQVLLVEPVLCLAGYNVTDPNIVKRADRGANKKQFDVEIYRPNGDLKIAIEVKAISSNEFNINDQFQIEERAGHSGNLALRCNNFQESLGKKKKTKIYNGTIWNCCNSTEQCKDGELDFCNYNNDGVGQLRAYCTNYLNQSLFRKDELEDKISELNSSSLRFLPIITNGKIWVIFKPNFVREPFNKIVVQDSAEAYADLKGSDFLHKIVKKLKIT